MRGLLLKDFYMVWKYCKIYLIVVLVFIAVFIVGDNSLYFVFYPCLLAGMIPITLIAYDERSGWESYCKGLPYTGVQIVSAKYIVGLCCQALTLLLTGIAFAARMIYAEKFDIGEFLYFLILVQVISCAASASVLPFLYRFGVEKGRIAYYVMVGLIVAGAFICMNLNQKDVSGGAALTWIPWAVCAAGIAVYALSWRLSVVFYRKREG